MITGRQVRAARALLNWKQEMLAEKALVALTALKRLESERGLQVRCNPERHIFAPWVGGDLHTDRQARGCLAATHHGGRPAGKIVGHRVTECLERPLFDRAAVRQSPSRIDR